MSIGFSQGCPWGGDLQAGDHDGHIHCDGDELQVPIVPLHQGEQIATEEEAVSLTQPGHKHLQVEVKISSLMEF
jgi:hypothetical protein